MGEKKFIQIEFTDKEVSLLKEAIMYRADCLKLLRVNASASGLFSIALDIDEELDILSDIEYKLDKFDLPF